MRYQVFCLKKLSSMLIFFIGSVVATSMAYAQSGDQMLRYYIGIDQPSPSKISSTVDLARQMFLQRGADNPSSIVRVYVAGEALDVLVKGQSPLEQTVTEFTGSGWDFGLIGCGEEVGDMRKNVEQGNTELLPTAELVDSCDNLIAKFQQEGWYSVNLP